MRTTIILFVALLMVFAILSTITIARNSDDGETNMHQNKNSNIVKISQGRLESPTDGSLDRKKLSKNVFSVRTKKESEIQKNNEKRLSYYKPRLSEYVVPKGEINILVTGYSSTPDQTWGNPFITASGTHVHKGTMACPPQYPFGTKVEITNKGTFICEDRGGAIKGNHFDMWFESRIEALQWGKRTVVATIEK